MTNAECEIVANAGVQLREIAERLTVGTGAALRSLDPVQLVFAMDRAALSISEVYGQLSALPLETPEPEPYYAQFYCTWPGCDAPRAYPHTSTLCAEHMAKAAANARARQVAP